MKLGKFISALAVSAVVALSVAMTAFAASPTPGSETSLNAEALASGVEGDLVKIDGVALDPTEAATLSQVSDADLALLEKAIPAGASVLKAVDAVPVRQGEQSSSIRFRFNGAAAGLKVYHKAAGADWAEVTDVEAIEGGLIVTCPSWSPVAFVSTQQSPGTGATSVLPIIAVICIAGLAFCGFRMKRLA